MKKLKIDKFLILGFLLLIPLNGGCAIAEIKEVKIPQNLVNASKDKILSEWGKPYRVYTENSKLDYGADELWIYSYPDTSSEGVYYYLYFKNGFLIRWDNKIIGDF